jgi:outer membrane protein assembly factor BamB
VALVALLVATVAVVGGAVRASASTPAARWSFSSIDVVGGPTLSAAKVLVLNITPSHTMRLTAISPTTGRELWSKPGSPSAITAGVAYSPVAVSDVVLNLAPAGPPTDPYVFIEGIAAPTGAVTWKITDQGLVMDAPVVCGVGTESCVAVATASATSLLIIDAVTGPW